ncbi:unnamed protein product [Wickerhamomyces anomalus]
MSDSKMQIDTPSPQAPEIDESLYSRQLYVLGKEAMLKMQNSNILIIGLRGLGLEIAKNVALAGVKSLSIYDPNPVELKDLSTQFFLTEDDIGKPRGQASLAKLAELNSYVPISIVDELSEETLSKFQVVVLTNVSLEEQVKINNFTHSNNIKFITTDTRGLFGNVFVDFGQDFTIVDPTGEEPLTGIVSDIESDGTVSVLDDNRHGLEDGDFVKFSEVQGLESLNDGQVFKVTVPGPYAFNIGDVSKLGTYKKGGIYTQLYINFKLDIILYQNHFNQEDANEFLHLVKNLATQQKFEGDLDEKLLTELSFQAQGDIPAINAFFGGLVAQEVLKASSGKFVPIKQFLYFDSLESLPNNYPRTEENTKPIGSRYDSQIAVFGLDFQKAIANVKTFLVGSGAIGCEVLKNWALMGLGSGPEGKIIVTDNDTIEKSNLNRQFLFRPKDVGKNKSEVAALAAVAMNKDLEGKIEAKGDKVGTETENIFDNSFWESLTFVTNALDNIDARTYVDRRCVFFNKPLLESGTLGTKGNTQVVIPRLTESYSSSQDPPEKAIPLCTLRSFPNKIDHTIAWAKSLFQGYFTEAAENVNLYLSQPNFLEATLKQSGDVKDSEFEKKYNHDIKQLLFNFPEDAKTSTGAPFWSGAKRAPKPLVFDINNPDHFHFVVGAANLRAFNYGLKGDQGEPDKSFYGKIIDEVKIEPFSPRSDVKIQANDDEPDPNAQQAVETDELHQLAASLPQPSTLAGYRLNPVEFEKDDDTNHHIEFITAASNARALNYQIDVADRQKTKFIAGRIIPAIATTTALVTGLAQLELYKVVDKKDKIEDYKNGFVNLALPFDIKGDITLQQLLDHFKEKEGLEITMLSYDVSLLYASFFPPKKVKERSQMKITELIKTVTKKDIPGHVKTLILEVCTDDAEGEDVEVPYVTITL